MTSTTITLNTEHRARRATGYNVKLFALPPWSSLAMLYDEQSFTPEERLGSG
jgi:hypothetical protein